MLLLGLNLHARHLKMPVFAGSRVKDNVTFGEPAGRKLVSRTLHSICVAVQLRFLTLRDCPELQCGVYMV